jgi:hypothetical protein
MDLSAVSGRIRVAAQAPAGFRYNVATRRSGGSNFNGVRSEGKGSLRARSHSGTVDICDR